MSTIESVINNLTSAINDLTASINATQKGHIINPPAPAPKKPDTPAPPKPAAPAAKLSAKPKLTMTPAANGTTYDQYMDAGWNDEQLISGGFAIAASAAPPAVITAEELNTVLIAEFNRLGNRTGIDAALKEFGVTGVTELPANQYQALIDKVKALK